MIINKATDRVFGGIGCWTRFEIIREIVLEHIANDLQSDETVRKAQLLLKPF